MKNLLIIIVLAGIGYYACASTPFLPMQKGQWQLTTSESIDGKRSWDKCMDDAELKKFYGLEYIEAIKNSAPSECTLTKQMSDEHIAVTVECTDKTRNLHATFTHEVTRKSKNRYLLARRVVTTPSLPKVELNKTIELTRLGDCK